MASFLSPRDPIFWLHHNMIEYLWVVRNLERGHPNTNSSAWTDRAFDGQFVNSDGTPLNGTGATVAFCQIYPLLAYQFEPSTVVTAAFASPPSDVGSGRRWGFTELRAGL